MHHRDELDAIQRELREIAGTHGHHLRPDLRHREAPPPQARHDRQIRPSASSSTSWSAKAAATARCRATACRSSRSRPSSAASAASTRPPATRTTRCLKGFCPSFVTVEGGKLKKREEQAARRGRAAMRCRHRPNRCCRSPDRPWGIVVAGVGGTGVITIGQLLGMAAHLEGKGIVTQDAAGLAQKGGATWSHVQIANRAGRRSCTTQGRHRRGRPGDRLRPDRRRQQGDAGASCATGRTLRRAEHARTPTAAFVGDPDWQFPQASCDAARASQAPAPTTSARSTPMRSPCS